MSGISRYNPSGCLDLTAYQALMNIEREAKSEKHMPVVYICSPLAGNVEANRENARKFCRFAVDKGCVPVAPHLLFPQFMDYGDPATRKLAVLMSSFLLMKCAELWVFGNRISKRMAIEIVWAKRRGIPIRYFTKNTKEAINK